METNVIDVDGSEVRQTVLPHINIPNGSDNIWWDVVSKVKTNLESYLPEERKPSYSELVNTTTKDYEIKNIIAGGLNLINYVIQEKQLGNEINTLVFLDKSARNGSLVFKTLWRELSKIQPEILGDHKMPKIRHLNVGHETTTADMMRESTKALILETIHADDYRSRFLLVDDIVASGNTMRKAQNVVGTIIGSEALGFSMFSETPTWYQHGEATKGVREGNSDPYDQIATALSPTEAVNLLNILKSIGSSKFLEIYDNLKIVKGVIGSADLDTITRLKQRIDMDSGEYLADFLVSAGGFFALPLQNENSRKLSVLYRNLLRDSAKVYVKEKYDN